MRAKLIVELLRLSRLLLLFCIALHLLPFLSHPLLMSGDEPHYALMAHSIAVDGDFDLENNYKNLVLENSKAAGIRWAGHPLDFHFIKHGSVEFFYHPLGLPLLLSPLVKVKELIAPGSAPDCILILATLSVTFLGLLAGKQLLADHFKDTELAWIVTLTIYFTTPLWFYSRTLFTEPYIWAFSVLSVYLSSRHRYRVAGIIAGMAFWIKEPTLITTACILLGVLRLRGIVAALNFILGMSPLLLLALYKNYALFGELFVTFQPYVLGNPLAGLIGTLFDLSHGLLVFAPVLILGVYYAIFHYRRCNTILLLTYLAILANYLLVALWRDWAGGSCYGPRLLVPIIPMFAIAIGHLLLKKENSRFFRVLFLVLVGLGFLVNSWAAFHPYPSFNTSPIFLVSGKSLMTLIPGCVLFCFFMAVLYRTRWKALPANDLISPKL